ncbi:MAG TPA: ArsR family transcriptional regulator [Methanomicrobia archaeon]|nr:ArsR family transcriptional regulator [Methanomicrobia archaeon]
MEREPSEGKLSEDFYVLIHPIRYRIVKLLADKPLHVNAIALAMGIERRHITYHLRILEDSGFITSKYGVSEEKKLRGKALRVCTLTDKVAEVKAALKKDLE